MVGVTDDRLSYDGLAWPLRLSVWMAGAPIIVRAAVTGVAVLPLAAIAFDGPGPLVGAVLAALVVTILRRRRTTMNATEWRLVARAVLTGISTGDPELDDHALSLLAQRRRSPMWLERLVLSGVALSLLVIVFVAARFASPWWLLDLPAVIVVAAGAVPYIGLPLDHNIAALSDETTPVVETASTQPPPT
jgi:hypothetical protein